MVNKKIARPGKRKDGRPTKRTQEEIEAEEEEDYCDDTTTTAVSATTRTRTPETKTFEPFNKEVIEKVRKELDEFLLTQERTSHYIELKTDIYNRLMKVQSGGNYPSLDETIQQLIITFLTHNQESDILNQTIATIKPIRNDINKIMDIIAKMTVYVASMSADIENIKNLISSQMLPRYGMNIR